jgi:hypothetical protein
MCVPRFAEHFSDLLDPRVPRCRQHALMEILVLAFVAVVCPAVGGEDIERFGLAKQQWFRQRLREQTQGQVIALDGKVLRHSFDTALGQDALHLVRAWATQERLVLGSVKVAQDSNEIPAVSTLLSLLDLRGCIVKADALHCQRAAAAQIVEQGGDYLLALKDNQAGVKARQKLAGWDNDYLLQLIA